jgi:glycosyltransferase involved in cell wall biosynthesis
VDRARFHPPEQPGAAAAGPPHIVCTRNHMPVYDIPTLLEALAALAAQGVAFRASLAGGGNLLEAHRRRAEELGLEGRVKLLGLLPHEDLPALLRRADLYVSPALSDGTSAALLEALATGLVPVVSDVPANRGWLEPGSSGLLFPPGDAAALAAALARALGDGELRARARREGPLRVAERGDLEVNMRRLAALLEAAAQLGT